MELILHAGLDKCGSTAIQLHLKESRDWFLSQGIYIPLTGLTALGHYPLFNNLNEPAWAPLLVELAEARHFSAAVISFEGTHFLPPEQLHFIQQQLQTFDLRILFYLREQSEIIQSGYLQKLKRGKQPHSMDCIQHDSVLLTPGSRDYMRMLEGFERLFPAAKIHPRVYDRSRLDGGNVVLDFLEYLDLSPDQGFQLSPQMHNSSLDVQAAQLLHVYDSVSDDIPGRETLVEDLLMLIDRHGGGDRQFLNDKAIRLITEHYAESNRMLRTQYGVDLTVDKTRANSTSSRHSKVTPGQYVSELAALSRFPRWNGGDLAGLALEDLLKRTRGWSRPTERGCWSSGRSSLISFRVPHAHRALGIDQPLSISFKGHYFANIRETELWSNGVRLGDYDLRDCVILLPSDQPDADGVIELELKHAAPVSPASLGKSPDERQLAYQLEAIQFTVPI